VLIRQIPATVEDVIETRIAVVGNGTQKEHILHDSQALMSEQSTLERAPCWGFLSKATSMTAEARHE
jgi:hypothetical protein